MPQEFIVVRCYDCETFQSQQVKKRPKWICRMCGQKQSLKKSQQVKKRPKWICKMCGQKQSLKKVYGRGTGAECRKRVQSLNLASGELRDAHEQECPIDASQPSGEESSRAATATSKWVDFIEESTTHAEDHDCTQDDVNVTTERPRPSGRRGGIRGRNNSDGSQRPWKTRPHKRKRAEGRNGFHAGGYQDPEGNEYSSGSPSSRGRFHQKMRVGAAEELPEAEIQDALERGAELVEESQQLSEQTTLGGTNCVANTGNRVLTEYRGGFREAEATELGPYRVTAGRTLHTIRATVNGELHGPADDRLEQLRAGVTTEGEVKVRKEAGASKWDAFLEEELEDVENIPEGSGDDFDGDDGAPNGSDRTRTVFSLGEEAEENLSWDD